MVPPMGLSSLATGMREVLANLECSQVTRRTGKDELGRVVDWGMGVVIFVYSHVDI